MKTIETLHELIQNTLLKEIKHLRAIVETRNSDQRELLTDSEVSELLKSKDKHNRTMLEFTEYWQVKPSYVCGRRRWWRHEIEEALERAKL